MDRILRSFIVCSLIGCVWYAPAGSACAAETGAPLRLAASGILDRSTDEKGVHYALTDEHGNTLYEIAPAGRVDLAAFVGQQVEVVGSLHAGGAGGAREIRAERVAPADRILPAYFVQVADEDAQRLPAAVVQVASLAAEEPALTPIPEGAPRNAPQGQTPPDLPEFPDLPPLMEGPRIDASPLFGEDFSTEGGGSLLLQPPTESLPPSFDAYQDPALQDPACGPKHWIWGNTEYLYWWTKSSAVPPLVTTSLPGTPQEDAGVLDLPSTRVLMGDSDLFDGGRDGWRWVFGGWLGPQRRMGLQLDYFQLLDDEISFTAASNGLQIVARPFTNVDPNLGPNQGPDAELISYPNVTAGSVVVNGSNQFGSLGIHLRGNMLCKNGCFYGTNRVCAGDCSGYRLDLLGGYRYIALEDSITIRQLTAVSITPQAGFQVVDSFAADNNFQGGELGLVYEWYRNRWSVDGMGKLALGRTQQKVSIDGSTELSTVGIVTPFEGGLLAQTTNIGNYSRKKTAVVPEFGLTVGYLLTSTLRVNCGYRVMYWPKVARAGDQIDMTVNGSYIPDPTVVPSGPARPQFVFQDTSFWAQGFSLGVDYRW